MARIIRVGEPVNDAERAVLRQLRQDGPADWTVIHNFEITRHRQTFEVDLAIVTDRACYIADTKGTHGRIEVHGPKWYPAGRQPFPSPVRKIREHAKTVASLLRQSSVSHQLGSVWCEELVILPYEDSRLVDPDGKDDRSTVLLKDLVPFLRRHRPSGGGPLMNITGLHDEIASALGAVSRPSSGPRRFGVYESVEALAEAGPGAADDADRVSVYRAVRSDQPNSGTYLVQVHTVDPLLPQEEHTRAREKIGNPLQALNKLPPSRNIVPCVDVVGLDDETGYAVVLKDVQAEALRVHLSGGGDRPVLGADAKRRVVSGVLSALAVAHGYRVVHRNITPDTVLVARNGTAMITGFDYAHTGQRRVGTVAMDAYERHDAAYLAPECAAGPQGFSRASDMFAAGVLFHELFTGELPVVTGGNRLVDSLDDASGLGPGIKDLIRRLLDADPARRPDAAKAVAELEALLRAGSGAGAGGGRGAGGQAPPGEPGEPGEPFDWTNPHRYYGLQAGFRLTEKFHVRKELGRGSFGVVYQVWNSLDETDEVLKIITRDRESVEARLKGEYGILRRLPPHPNLVRVIDADWLPKGGFPYLRMEFAEGHDLQAVSRREHKLGAADVRRLLEDCLSGLDHLHRNGVYHCDIKPSNLLWTPDGTKLLDFNAAVSVDSTLSPTLGSPKYYPPDSVRDRRPTRAELADLDLYALGISAYAALTGDYPWPRKHEPPRGEPGLDPRKIAGLHDLSRAFAELLMRAVAPRRADRFPDAEAFLAAVRAVGEVRVTPASRQTTTQTRPGPSPAASEKNTNSFVAHLQTLYSQSGRTNAGTRGLDPAEFPLYVATALDTRLQADVLAGNHRLVVITGNAGDGKTAFLERLAAEAAKRGAVLGDKRVNGDDFVFQGRSFHTNHDGSQDEGERDNGAVLDAFLSPYRGADPDAWPADETRLIAINEGRLVDFVTEHGERYPLLAEAIREGLGSGRSVHGITVVNLNVRDVIADPDGIGESILHRMIGAMTDERHWAACASCDLAPRCYARHNAQTFAHPAAGPQVTERLAALYRMTHLRGRLHITLRDLRSALAYTLTSGRDCAQIHELYDRPGSVQDRMDGFYFTSWAGIHTVGSGETDRLLAQLRELDIATVPDPQLDRRLDYTGPAAGHSLISVDQRGGHDATLLADRFKALPRTPAAHPRASDAHRAYLAGARRRFFFESLDDERWKTMLSYHSGGRFLDLLTGDEPDSTELERIIDAVNRGEGLPGAALDGQRALALQVRSVPGGTVRSYRLFPADRFTLAVGAAPRSPYVETGPRELVLRYEGVEGTAQHRAELVVRLDLYELLDRLHAGHQPGVEDRQGQHLALAVFKNALSATPYQEVLLTAPGNVPHRITRLADGALRLAPVETVAGGTVTETGND
ncbi:protein kinase [Streptomyces sp. ICN988]|uniref:methylation-associated defense system protein kinase MAD6 n=1 Tax=Streptomyces sp. ICN988 TaxID=2983765 RepID=UPI0021E3ABAB|nr:protein kinase [Streptomyces sp. ICN988]MCV2459436.1 protein kinase [Streptomyces sp. ICN988]